MKGVRYYCEVLRRCFGEYLGQSRIAITVHHGQQSRHEATTFLSPSNSTDLHLENEKPFTKGIFEPLMRIIEPLKKGKDKPLLRIIEPLRRIFDPVVDRVRSMVCKAVCGDISNKEGTHNFFPKPVGIRSIALDPKSVVIDPVIDTCSWEAAILQKARACQTSSPFIDRETVKGVLNQSVDGSKLIMKKCGVCCCDSNDANFDKTLKGILRCTVRELAKRVRAKHAKRDREPSRVPLKMLIRKLKKRVSRQKLKKIILKSTPVSSKMHHLLQNYSLCYKNYDESAVFIGHLDEFHYVSTEPLPWCPSISKEQNKQTIVKPVENISSVHNISFQGSPKPSSQSSRKHFMNFCLTQPGKFSCAVDCYLELASAIFKDSLKHTCIDNNDFFQIVLKACLQLENNDQLTDLTVVREPVWAYLRQHCYSFATLSDNAIFSDIFTLNTVGVMTPELKSLFLVQKTSKSICSSCNKAVLNHNFIYTLHNVPKLASKQI